MDLIELSEISMLILSIFYGYQIFTKPYKLYKKDSVLLFLSLSSIVLNVSSFQVYWFTSLYERHKYLDIFIKIILFIFSIINQIFLNEMEEDEYQMKMEKKKDDFYDSYTNSIDEGNIGFKLVNGLLILNILYKVMCLNEQWL